MNTVLLRAEIERYFTHRRPGKAYELMELADGYRGWVIRLSDGSFGVAVPYDGEVVYESFAGATMKSLTSEELGFSLPQVLALLSDSDESRNEFSLVCADFADPGDDDGQRRSSLTDAPREWWGRWKSLLGNHVQTRSPSGVLGELLVYAQLLEDGQRVQWSGPDKASHDLHTEDYDVEVKSTTKRYGCVVHIAGQYQLQQQAPKLYLYFCRMEPHPAGISIDDAVDYLVGKHHMNREELNKKLARLGYHVGSGNRAVTYAIQEMRRYMVDEAFPSITPESFKADAIPKGITQLSYDLDLADLPYEPVVFDLNKTLRQ